MGEQGDQREQPQERRCSAPYRHIRPLALRLESQVPAHHKPTEDLLRISLEVGTQEGLGFELSFGITDQHPAQGHGEQPSGVPHGCLGSDLDRAILAPVPASDLGRLPNGSRVLGYLRKVGQALTLYACSPSLARAPWRSLSRRGQHPSASGL